jgi:hypothetical protein
VLAKPVKMSVLKDDIAELIGRSGVKQDS